MSHVILGLLLIAPQSLYDLGKAFESGISLFYSASTGSIKRALDSLLARGLVSKAEDGARGRKLYRVTPEGEAEFFAWLREAPTGSDAETAILSRLFFLGHLPAEERAGVLAGFRERMDAERARFEALGAHLDALSVSEEHREIFAYQRATLDYGLAAAEQARDWLDAEAARA